jgi:multicomponent Na+:H+ antiporter subunit B
MMDSLILRTATRLLLALMILFSIFILWRGHNEPGGGFVGGLICAVAFALHALAFGVKEMKRLLVVDPRSLLGGGLLLGILSGFFAGPGGDPFMTARWVIFKDANGAKALALGTPVLFDIGVYLVVVGALLAMIQGLMEED